MGRPTALSLEVLSARDVPSAVAAPTFTDFAPGGYSASYAGDAGTPDPTPGGYSAGTTPVRLIEQPGRSRLAVATGAGQRTVVHVLDGPTGAFLGSVTPFGDGYTAGARVATGDVTGDGVADVVAATGPGVAPEVRVFDGKTLAEVGRFAPYERTFTGGVFLGVGDVTGDGRADIVTSAGAGGGPLVKVFDARTPAAPVRSFLAFEPGFRGGATLAVGDVDGDGAADIVTGAGVGGGPRVVVTSGRTGRRLQDFFAFSPGARGGVSVAVADIAGKPTVATALLDGSGNQVRLFQNGYQTGMFTPFDAGDARPQARTPATVAFVPVRGGRPALAVGTPAGQSQQVRVIDPSNGAVVRTLPAVTPEYVGGLFVG